ncbi:MAG: tetratricopeptide repeat protein [Rhodospirillales bacterium]|nr:tetratricopeptide repeat protein [Rhodospirillales bacterium]
MSDLLREIDEDLRIERLRRLGRRYGPAAAGAAGFVALAIGGWFLWQNHLDERRAEDADRYAAAIAALEAGNTGLGISDLADLTREAEPGYALLAKLSEAAALTASGDPAAAISLYDTIARDDAAPAHFRAVADLHVAFLLLDQGAAATIRERIAWLLADPTGPWYPLAREVSAHLAYRESEIDTAKSEFQELATDANVPNGVRVRARRMLLLWPDVEG